MVRIKRLGHVGITVPNVEETAAFYENVIGMEISDRAGGAVFLRCNEEHHCLSIHPGKTRSLHHLGLEVSDAAALQVAHETLAKHVQPEESSYARPGYGSALCYRDPDGNSIELYEGMQTLEEPLEPREVRPTRFGHITFTSTDLHRALSFYTDRLGFRVSDWLENDALVWLRCNQEHHGVAILGSGESNVNHYCFDLADWNDFKRVADHLYRNDVPIIYGPSRHGPGSNLFIYIADPAGNIIELSAEMMQVWDEETYEPQTWKNEPKTVDVWRALAQPRHMLACEGRDFNDWSAGSPVIGRGWSVLKEGDFIALDPAAKITTPTADLPEFKIEIPRFTLGCDNPADHVKAMITADRRFPAGDGLSAAVDIAVDVHGSDPNPFDADPDDPRLGSGSISLIDDSTGLVLNFEVSNRRIMALRELFVVNAPGGDSGSVKPMADPFLTDLTIEPGSWHRYEICYYPGEDGLMTPGPDHAEWLVDGEIVQTVAWVATVDPPAAPIIKPARFTVNLAIFTLLDDLPDGRGGTLPGLDPDYEQTIFGQGVTARWRNLVVQDIGSKWHVR